MFGRNPSFRKSLLELDEIAESLLGVSVAAEIYDLKKSKHEAFDRTLYSHPALFMVQYALARSLLEEGIRPAAVMGTSMGEFVAAAVAGVAGPEAMLTALIRQAQVLEARCDRGFMTAVLDNEDMYRSHPELRDRCEMAASNFQSHFVVSGHGSRQREVEGFLKAKGAVYQTLPVTQGFHSAVIDPARPGFLEAYGNPFHRRPGIPFISCVTGGPMGEIRPDYFWSVVREPILFRSALAWLASDKEVLFLDLGPSGTLATFSRYNLIKEEAGRSLSILTPFGQDFKNMDRVRGWLQSVT